MADDENLYKREEDRKWRERVDYEQITIKTAHQVLSDKLDELEEKLEGIDNLLRGDPLSETSGLIEQYHQLRAAIAKLDSVVFMDSTGKHGLAHDVDVLMGRKRDRDQGRELHWKFWTAIAVAIISTVGLALTNLDKLHKFLYRKPDKLSQMIEEAKHPRKKQVRYRVIPRPPGPGPADEADPRTP